MKAEITRKGVVDQDGKPVPVGTVIPIRGGIPAWLRNKCRVVADPKGELTVNPKRRAKDEAET